MKFKSNFAIIGIICGFIFSLFSGLRYYVLYTDIDKALVYVGVGVIISVVSYMYERIVSHELDIKAIEDYLSESNYKGGKRQ